MTETGNAVPRHVGIIMDGNGRWAKQRGLPRLAGHRAGTKNLRRVIRAAANAGVRHLTFYAFSTENWRRPQDEVNGLLGLLGEFIETETPELHKEGARLLHIGHLDQLDPCCAKKLRSNLPEQYALMSSYFRYGGRQSWRGALSRLAFRRKTPSSPSTTCLPLDSDGSS